MRWGRCPVDAIIEDENYDKKSLLERAKYVGCGVCVIGCPTGAIKLEPVSAEEWFHASLQYGGMGRARRLEYLAAQK